MKHAPPPPPSHADLLTERPAHLTVDHRNHEGGPGHEPDEHDEHGVEKADLIRIGLVAIITLAVWLGVWEPLPRWSVVGTVGTIVGGWPIFKEAWANLRQRRMTMELSMTIALAAALVVGEFVTALIITLFVLIAEVLEGLTVSRGRRAIQDLLDCLPPTVTVRRPDGPVRVPLANVGVGDIVLVSPGERIAVDGTVCGGRSYVDQASITGESTPIAKSAGAGVYAGTVNQSGVLEVSTERVGRDTSFGKIVDAVERAERSRAPVQKTADRYAGSLVYFALACALVTFALTRDARSTISVIIVAGACGIAAGTPLAILGAIGLAARAGSIVKGGRYLEALWRIDTVAFDKTGTLTVGKPSVRGIRPAPGVTEREVIEAAALAERRSEHPLALAILQRAAELGVEAREPDDFTYVPGRGIAARRGADRVVVGNHALLSTQGLTVPARGTQLSGESEVFVAKNGQFLGVVAVGDIVRQESAAALAELRALGLRTLLLSGDATNVALAIGGELGFDDVRADMLPNEKVEAIRQLVDSGATVAMVGDGINDAPALMQASVGVAMGSGTDVARESADVVLLGNDLTRLVETFRIAHKARRIIQFNFLGTIAVDVVGVGLAAFGLLSPLFAALIHVVSELAFILNSARLLPVSR